MVKPTSQQNSVIPPLWLITLGSLAIFIWVLLELREIVILLVVGYCIAYLIDPLLEFLERRRIPRSIGVFLVFGGAVVICVILFLTALPTLGREYEKLSSNLPAYVDDAKQKLVPILDKIKATLPARLDGEGAEKGAGLLSTLSGQTVKGVIGGVVTTLLSGYNIVLVVVNLALLPFIVYYISLDFRGIHKGALLLFPVAIRRKAASLAHEIDSHVAAFVRGQLIVGAILTVLYMIGLRVVGVELWILLGLISGFGNLIPYFGFLAGILLSSIMALVTFGDLSHLLQVWGVYIVVQMLEGTFITPKIVGEKVGLSPLVVILSIFAGGTLFGLLGIFLAVPGAAAVKVLWRETHGWLLSREELRG